MAANLSVFRVLGIPLVAALALSGCSDSAPENLAGADPGAPTDGKADDATDPVNGSALPIEPVDHPLAWTGSIPYGAWLCDAAVAKDCLAQPADAYGTEFRQSDMAGNIVGGNLTLTWVAASPLTTDMSLGMLVDTPGCDTCNRTHLGPDITGPSPLTFAIPAGTVIDEGAGLHVWVYGGPSQGAGPEYVGLSGKQDFSLAGAVSVLPASA